MKTTLAQRLRAARQAITPEITQRDVAKHLGLSPSAINLYEQGKTEPSASTLAELSRWYQVSCDWLLGVDTGNPSAIASASAAPPVFTVPVLPPGAIARWHWDIVSELLQTAVDYPAGTAAAMLNASDALSSLCPVGSLAVISKAHIPVHGQVVAAVVGKSNEPVLRKYIREGGDDLLVADDTRFPTYRMDDGVRIVGLVTEIIIRKILI